MKFISPVFFLWILNIPYKTTTATDNYPALTLVHDGGRSFDVVDDLTSVTGEPFKVIILACPIEDNRLKEEVEKSTNTNFKRSLAIAKIHASISEITSNKICKNQVLPGIKHKDPEKAFAFGYRLYINNDQIQFISNLIKNSKLGLPSELTKGYTGRLRISILPNIYWYVVTNINILPNGTKIADHSVDTHNYKQKPGLKKCENYNFGKYHFKIVQIAEIYKKEYQNSILNKFKKLTSSKIKPDQIYLVEQQLTAIDDFDSRSERVVTCSYLNVSPMWTTIANGWWKQVQKIIQGIAGLKPIVVTTGTYGTLRLPDSKNPKEMKKVLLKDTLVPKLYWKLVKYFDENEDKKQIFREGVLVFTYNYISSSVPHKPLCAENNCKKLGWENLDNKHYSTGFTYCCSPKKELLKDLGLEGLPKVNDSFFETLISQDPKQDGKMHDKRP